MRLRKRGEWYTGCDFAAEYLRCLGGIRYPGNRNKTYVGGDGRLAAAMSVSTAHILLTGGWILCRRRSLRLMVVLLFYLRIL